MEQLKLSTLSTKNNHLNRRNVTALKNAAKSQFSRARVGCIITKGGRIISTGFNAERYTQHNHRDFPSLHAEESAIIKQLNNLHNLHNAKIFISRVKADGSLGLAKPCNKCMKMIQAVGIRSITYTTDQQTTETIKP